MKSQVLHTVWCYISGEAAGEIWIDHSQEWHQWKQNRCLCFTMNFHFIFTPLFISFFFLAKSCLDSHLVEAEKYGIFSAHVEYTAFAWHAFSHSSVFLTVTLAFIRYNSWRTCNCSFNTNQSFSYFSITLLLILVAHRARYTVTLSLSRETHLVFKTTSICWCFVAESILSTYGGKSVYNTTITSDHHYVFFSYEEWCFCKNRFVELEMVIIFEITQLNSDILTFSLNVSCCISRW